VTPQLSAAAFVGEGFAVGVGIQQACVVVVKAVEVTKTCLVEVAVEIVTVFAVLVLTFVVAW